MHIVESVFLFLLGASFGSFFNVAGMRIPAGKSVVRPHSACNECGEQIRGADLLPIAGWLMQRGRCRHCGSRISPLYLLSEVATGAAFAILPHVISDWRELTVGYLLVSLLAVLTVSDLTYRLLPNKIVFPAMLAFLLLRIFVHPLPFWEYMVGFVVGGGMLYAVSLGAVLLKKPAMGGGDIKLMALLGMILGGKLVLLAILISALTGTLTGMFLIACKIIDRRTFIPFGPFIALGGFLSFLVGEPVIAWYLGLFL
ncbi:MAG TPA: A24 family peptidase [Bacilli bacterium]